MKTISNSFATKAKTYDTHAIVQRKIVDFTVKLAKENAVSDYGLWLDLGSGTGFVEKELQKKIEELNIIKTDIAFSKKLDVCADFDFLPFKNNSFDKIISCSAFQWSKDLERLFEETYNTLKNNKDSRFIFSIFANGTLENLSVIQKRYGIISEVLYYDKDKIENLLKKTGFKIVASEQKTFYEKFENSYEALRSISRIGATTHRGEKLTANLLRNFIKDYEISFESKEITHDYKTLFYIAEKI